MAKLRSGTRIYGNALVDNTLTVSGNVAVTTSSLSTFSGAIQVGTGVTVGVSSITVGNNFIGSNSIGLGQVDTTSRNAGVGTVIGTLIYNITSNSLEVYTNTGATGWKSLQFSSLTATGGTLSTPGDGYTYHTFTSPGTFTKIGRAHRLNSSHVSESRMPSSA